MHWSRALIPGLTALVTSLAKAARVLFLEVAGFMFLVFALVGVSGVVREYPAWAVGKRGPAHLAAATAFALMFGWFGVSSFVRARKNS